MKKIEEAMLEAIKNGQNWRQNNTEVVVAELGSVFVYLYGHLIMHKHYDGRVKFNAHVEATEEIASATTLSRLRALGLNVTSRKGCLFVDGKIWTGCDIDWRAAK